MRKTLTALAVTAAAFAVPMLGAGTAYADTSAAVNTSAVTQVVDSALGGGCTTTYVAQLEGVPLGAWFSINGLTVTVYGGMPVSYAQAQEHNTENFGTCVV